jgi:hypothetical protein
MLAMMWLVDAAWHCVWYWSMYVFEPKLEKAPITLFAFHAGLAVPEGHCVPNSPCTVSSVAPMVCVSQAAQAPIIPCAFHAGLAVHGDHAPCLLLRRWVCASMVCSWKVLGHVCVCVCVFELSLRRRPSSLVHFMRV